MIAAEDLANATQDGLTADEAVEQLAADEAEDAAAEEAAVAKQLV